MACWPPIQFDDLPIEFSIKWWIFQAKGKLSTFEEKTTRDLMAEFRTFLKCFAKEIGDNFGMEI
jgi:hypothetical protein